MERHGIHVVPLYVVFGGDRTVPETDITDYDAFFEELRGAEHLPTTSQPSVGDFTTRVRAAARRRRRGGVRAHLGRALGHARVGPPRGRDARARGQAAASGCTWWTPPPPRRARAARARRGARPRPTGWPATRMLGPRARKELKLWFADRHARVPAARRAHRRRQRLDRLDAEGEADPHRGERDDPGGAGAHQLARVRADGGLRPPVPRVGRRRLVRAAHQRPRDPRPPGGARAGRCSAASPPSSARSGRCSPCTPARASWARAASRPSSSRAASPRAVRAPPQNRAVREPPRGRSSGSC